MFGAILNKINISFQKGMTLCRSIYVKKVMKLLAFIFEQSSYLNCDFIQICRKCILIDFELKMSSPPPREFCRHILS